MRPADGMSRAPGHSPGTGKNAWRRNLNAGGAFPPTGGDAADTRSNRGGGDMVSILAEGETCWRSAQADRMSRSEEHTSELQSLMRITYAVFCLKKKRTM